MIHQLLSNLNPKLDKRTFAYVFRSAPLDGLGKHSFAIIQEDEGLTYIVESQIADQFNQNYHLLYCKITLQVDSPLTAVGLTFMVSSELAKLEIPCNLIAGFNHDHIFVPTSDAKQAHQCLMQLQLSYQNKRPG